MVEDASNSHLLVQLILADACQCGIVGTRPRAALHQDGKRGTVQQGCNGDQTEQVDSINVLQIHITPLISIQKCCVLAPACRYAVSYRAFCAVGNGQGLETDDRACISVDECMPAAVMTTGCYICCHQL